MSVFQDVYYDPRAPGSFGGISALQRHIKDSKSRAETVAWLRAQPTYTQHYPVRYKYRRNRTVVYTKGEQFQADLADVSSVAKHNDGVKFLLACIDIFSKYAWVVPLENKKWEISVFST